VPVGTGFFPSRFRLLQSQLLLLLRCCSPNAISRPPLYLVSISLCIDLTGWGCEDVEGSICEVGHVCTACCVQKLYIYR
jgi:hypothetical protein